jgi:chloride channel 7
MGGLIGACFNSAQQQIFQIRKSFYDRPLLKYFEVVCIVTVMTAISYWLPTLWGACVPLPNAAYSSAISVQEQNLIKELVPLYCSSDTHYNDLGSLFLNDGDTCIRLLYHFREEGNQNDITFSSSALFLFFVPYIVMSCFTFGSGVPAGTFVPSILSGAAFGRLVGHLLHRLDSTSGTFADGGTYALIGSGAVSGGITRLTISLVVVILEATGDMQYLLPLIVVVMAAVFVGKCFTPGLYDIYIYNRNLHFLEEEDSLSSDIDTSGHSVSEVMLRNPICLVPCVRVDELLSVLEAEPRSHFAVVSDRYSNTLVGTISRKVLLILLKKKAFVLKPMISRQASKDLSLEEIEELHSESPDLATLILSFSQSDRRQYLDMSFYIEDVPYIIQSHASVGRAYRMFRSLGLSHLVVVSSDRANFGERFYCDKSSARVDADARIVVGIIFRHNLLQSNLSSLCKFE